jgi:hypothetical protein
LAAVFDGMKTQRPLTDQCGGSVSSFMRSQADAIATQRLSPSRVRQ